MLVTSDAVRCNKPAHAEAALVLCGDPSIRFTFPGFARFVHTYMFGNGDGVDAGTGWQALCVHKIQDYPEKNTAPVLTAINKSKTMTTTHRALMGRSLLATISDISVMSTV